jgi:hypothetical protein
VKRDRPKFRVFRLSILLLILVCFVYPRVEILAGPQSQSQSPTDENKLAENKPKDDAKSKDNVKKDTPGEVIKPGRTLKMDVDLALVNVTVTDPYNRLVTGLEMEISAFLRTTPSRKW